MHSPHPRRPNQTTTTLDELTDLCVRVSVDLAETQPDRAHVLDIAATLRPLISELERIAARYAKRRVPAASTAATKLQTTQASLSWLREYGDLAPVSEIRECIRMANRSAMIALGWLRSVPEAGMRG